MRPHHGRQIQFGINKIICVLLAHSCVAVIKEVFNRMGLDAGSVAYPGKVFDRAESDVLLKELRENGLEI